MNWIRIGVWVWGTLTVVCAALAFLFVFWGAAYLNDQEKLVDAPAFVRNTYVALKDHGSLIGALIGFSALGWAYFFQVYTQSASKTQ